MSSPKDNILNKLSLTLISAYVALIQSIFTTKGTIPWLKNLPYLFLPLAILIQIMEVKLTLCASVTTCAGTLSESSKMRTITIIMDRFFQPTPPLPPSLLISTIRNLKAHPGWWPLLPLCSNSLFKLEKMMFHLITIGGWYSILEKKHLLKRRRFHLPLVLYHKMRM